MKTTTALLQLWFLTSTVCFSSPSHYGGGGRAPLRLEKVPHVQIPKYQGKSAQFIRKDIGYNPILHGFERNEPVYDSNGCLLRRTTFLKWVFEARNCKGTKCKDWVQLTKHSKPFWTRSPNCGHNVFISQNNWVFTRLEVILERNSNNQWMCFEAYWVCATYKDYFGKEPPVPYSPPRKGPNYFAGK